MGYAVAAQFESNKVISNKRECNLPYGLNGVQLFGLMALAIFVIWILAKFFVPDILWLVEASPGLAAWIQAVFSLLGFAIAIWIPFKIKKDEIQLQSQRDFAQGTIAFYMIVSEIRGISSKLKSFLEEFQKYDDFRKNNFRPIHIDTLAASNDLDLSYVEILNIRLVPAQALLGIESIDHQSVLRLCSALDEVMRLRENMIKKHDFSGSVHGLCMNVNLKELGELICYEIDSALSSIENLICQATGNPYEKRRQLRVN
ncbi:hypothetical protein [Comamonas sp. JUb58]|uniref:hypothetical protein n=1 Tax=Comamonas sp. JUb58 TaxID=2485114 RepID=UPI00105DA281|nr:hypothetical protein [Comamonas sp. JUb58]TDS70450.1 hypothetical protein EDF71_13138 [Comamonas sp. JUb58]